MLVLSRQPGESVVMGEGADARIVTVLEIRGGKVRLGFAAPPTVRINRHEVYEAIHGELPALMAGDRR